MKEINYLTRILLGLILFFGVASCDDIDTYDPYNDCQICQTSGIIPDNENRDTIIVNVNGNFLEVFGQRETSFSYLNVTTDENESYNIKLDQSPNANSSLLSILSKDDSKVIAGNENFFFDSSSPKLYYDLVDLEFYWVFWLSNNVQSLIVEMDNNTWLREPAVDRTFFFDVDYEIMNNGKEIIVLYDNKLLHIIDGS